MQQAHKLQILIADGHLLIRQGLKQILIDEFRDAAFGEAGSAEEAVFHFKSQRWHLVVLDVGLPKTDGLSVLREIRALRPKASVLMLSGQSDSEYAARSLELGALGCVSKTASRSELLKAVRIVLNGGRYFSETLFTDVARQTSLVRHRDLSAQERRVLLALASGKRIGETASELKLSTKTISTYKRRLLDKLDLRSTADLVRYVIDHKLS